MIGLPGGPSAHLLLAQALAHMDTPQQRFLNPGFRSGGGRFQPSPQLMQQVGGGQGMHMQLPPNFGNPEALAQPGVDGGYNLAAGALQNQEGSQGLQHAQPHPDERANLQALVQALLSSTKNPNYSHHGMMQNRFMHNARRSG